MMPVNGIRTSIHPAAWIPRWSTANAPIALERAAALGFDHLIVPLRRFEDIDPPGIAKAFERFAMTPVNSAGLAPDADISHPDQAVRLRGLERLRMALRLARDMGSKQIGGVLYTALKKFDGPASPEGFLAAAEAIRRVGEEAQAAGVRLALEIVNRYESNLLNTVAQALEFLDAVACDNVYLHLDTFHMNIEEDDLLRAIGDAMPRLAYFELDQNHRGAPTPGLIDFTALLREVCRLGYRGIVGVEAFSRSNLAEDHADALAIWRDTFNDGDRVASQAMVMITEAFRGR